MAPAAFLLATHVSMASRMRFHVFEQTLPKQGKPLLRP